MTDATDADFELATKLRRSTRMREITTIRKKRQKPLTNQGLMPCISKPCEIVHKPLAERTGFEQPQQTSGKTAFLTTGGTESGTLAAQSGTVADADLARLLELWPQLSADCKIIILAAAEQRTIPTVKAIE